MVIITTMANNYFQLKQFTVYQDTCAMKVTTDSCLFGAWAAAVMKLNEHDLLLDIGAGTGLLSLMAAQKNNCRIDAVEIDKDAFVQAGENAAQSPWKERINIINADIRQWPAERKYSCIISNPPFFENQLASPDAAKNKALHAQALSLAELFAAFDKHIVEGGKIFLLMPAYRKEEVISMAEVHGYFIEQMVMVKQTPAHEPFRILLQLHLPVSQRPNGSLTTTEETLTIRQSNNEYSAGFTALLKDYYLYL
jgi:tRNA1Val (adenine37-N6)-methyltransferase